VSSSSDSSKFFGLVTSAFHQEDQSGCGDLPCDSFEGMGIRKISISNSCHVFVIDTKLTDHLAHLPKAEKFKIICTKDLISNSCLEFPTTSDYIVNIIRSMYNIKSPVKAENVLPGYRPSAMRNLNFERDQRMAHSPHPSNHSEITTSSNSDSGIGFHNDYANISDRILVVDFPGLNQNIYVGARNPNQVPPYIQRVRPFGIVNDHQLQDIPQPSTSSELPVFHTKSKSADYNTAPHQEEINPRLAIRAMPDPVINSKVRSNGNYENIYPKAVTDVWYNGMILDEAGHIVGERPIDVPDSFDCLDEDQRVMMVRSCDNIMMVMDKEEARYRKSNNNNNNNNNKSKQTNCVAIDNVANNETHIFVAPKPPKRMMNKKSLTISGKTTDSKPKNERNLLHYKLSPKVFGLPRPVSMSFENLSSTSKRKSLWGSKSKKEKSNPIDSIWGSLHELRHSEALKNPQHDYVLEGTYSEPSLHQIVDSDVSTLIFFPIHSPLPRQRLL
jgi:regulator of G-protein signaling